MPLELCTIEYHLSTSSITERWIGGCRRELLDRISGGS
jgi:hypothetical protein